MKNQSPKTCAVCAGPLDCSTEVKVRGGWLGWCAHCREWQPAASSRLAIARQKQAQDCGPFVTASKQEVGQPIHNQPVEHKLPGADPNNIVCVEVKKPLQQNWAQQPPARLMGCCR